MAGPWSVMDPLAASSSSSSSTSSDDSHSESDSDGAQEAKDDSAASEEKKGLKKNTLDFEAISKHGYSGGPSVLYVPPPKSNPSQEDQDWSWSCGKRKAEDGHADDQLEESLAQRNETRHTTNTGAVQAAAKAIAEYNYAKKQRQEAAAEAKALSFAQKEKRKRDFGQASRGKNYVEEEKRILRDQGVYSGFDV